MKPETPDYSRIFLMLGEMSGDLKYLVEERRSTNRRLDEVEARMEKHVDELDDRVALLEAFKIRVGVLTGALGVLVPTGLTVLAHYFGLL
ncbi:hypothetical protein [Shimia sp.]|uniref:hypothetical protein n=1 Tax=Shimia sp. TaxID=1954381 RepID=UPI003BAB1486